MNKLFKKLKGRRGESFVEILLSILIVSFGCLLIATMYTTAMNLNVQASKQDSAYYETLSETEQMFEGADGTKGTAVITDEGGNTLEKSVQVYGDEKNSAYKGN